MPHQQPIHQDSQPAAQTVPTAEATPVAQTRLAEPSLAPPVQLAAPPNNTGLPDNLKSGIENLSGYSMDDVRVHYNSSKPAQLNAHAYAQGTDIHVAPGQERHLPHEAWHVVQQKQGRVQATRQLRSKVAINDDPGLEKEADVMGRRAVQRKTPQTSQRGNLQLIAKSPISPSLILQGKWIINKRSGEYREIADDANPPFGWRDLAADEAPPRVPTMAEKREDLRRRWSGKSAQNRKPSEMDIVRNPPAGEVEMAPELAVLGTDKNFADGNLLLPEVTAQAGRHAENKRPTYMAGFLHNKGEDWSADNQQEFLDQVRVNADRIEVAHNTIQRELDATEDPAAKIEEIVKQRKANNIGTPEEVDQLLNGQWSKILRRRVSSPTHRWVKTNGAPGDEGYERGHLRKR